VCILSDIDYLRHYSRHQYMNVDLVLTNVCKHISLSKKEKDIFTSLLQSKTLKRKEFLLQAGDICKHTSFVVEGCMKAFTVDKEGGEHILNFAFRDWWIADLYSLISQKPGTLNIEAITETEILIISRNDQQKLYQRIPKFERFFRILVENSLVASHQRLIDNVSMTAEERYVQYIKKYPLVLECVPQHSIASYLGITPEFLSKIRSRLAKRS
jgi:CRP-like cAMP-binding protein